LGLDYSGALGANAKARREVRGGCGSAKLHCECALSACPCQRSTRHGDTARTGVKLGHGAPNARWIRPQQRARLGCLVQSDTNPSAGRGSYAGPGWALGRGTGTGQRYLSPAATRFFLGSIFTDLDPITRHDPALLRCRTDLTSKGCYSHWQGPTGRSAPSAGPLMPASPLGCGCGRKGARGCGPRRSSGSESLPAMHWQPPGPLTIPRDSDRK
jgi:hypothetical protein